MDAKATGRLSSLNQRYFRASMARLLRRASRSFSLGRPSLPGVLIFPVAFFAAYHFATGLTSFLPSPFWFPDSVLLCALLLSPRKTWWFYLLSALPLRIFPAHSGYPWWFLIACFVNDSAKVLLSAALIQRFCGKKLRFDTLQQFLSYSLIAVIFVPLLSSIAGGASEYALGDDFLVTSRRWFLGDALAGLVLTPMLLCFFDAGRQILKAPARRYWEATLLLAGVVLSGYFAFIEFHPPAPFLLYFPMPFLLWSAVRFGPFGTACSLSGISALSIFAIFRGQGPFAGQQVSSSLLSLQLFLIVISFSLLALTTVVRQQKTGEAALRASEERLHQLSARLILAQEAERKYISEELHEDVAQRVAALSIGLCKLAQISGGAEGLAEESSRLCRHATEIMNDISRLSSELRPPTLEGVGLSAALTSLCAQMNDPPGRNIVYCQFGEMPSFSWEIAVSLYRIAQECVSNALRHSGASCISVCLSCKLGGHELSIRDNGRGFTPGIAAARGMGIAGMAERMRSVGGRLQIDSIPGKGTEVVAFVPDAGHSCGMPLSQQDRELQHAVSMAAGRSR